MHVIQQGNPHTAVLMVGLTVVWLPSVLQVKYAYVTQRGYYPDAPDKANQDTFLVRKDVGSDSDTMFLGVFDGHGTAGTECAQFACEKVTAHAWSAAYEHVIR